MTFWQRLMRLLFGKGGTASEETLCLNIEKARREFKDGVTDVNRIRAKLAGLEKGGAESAGEVKFCRQDLDRAERKALNAADAAERWHNELRALEARDKGRKLQVPPAVSTAELEEIRKTIFVSRQLLDAHEAVLKGIDEEEYSQERKNSLLEKPREAKSTSKTSEDTPRIEPVSSSPVTDASSRPNDLRAEPPGLANPVEMPRPKKELES